MRVVHIGFPKTATSYLQAVVFPLLPTDFVYFDATVSAQYFDPVIDFDDTIFDIAAHRKRFERAWNGKRRCLFSYEPLTGAHYRSAFVNRTLIAKRLKTLGFDRTIVTIRNQFDALESAYKQYVKSGGTLKFDEYINFDRDAPQYLYPEYFDYLTIYRLYARIFGPENVLLLQHEHLSNGSFLRSLGTFLNAELPRVVPQARINASLSYEKTRLLRVLNHLTYSAYQPSHLISRRISTAFLHRQLARLPFLNSRRSFVTAEKHGIIAAYYAPSNARLATEAGIVLAADYPS